MLNVFERARAYYQSTPSDPWQWAEEARVLVWADGSTIAFREELAEILEGLGRREGLPPFRMVVLILAACRGKLPPCSETGPAILDLARPLQIKLPAPFPEQEEQGSFRVWNDSSNQEFSELLAGLRVLHELPDEQKFSPRAKVVLIESIIERLSVKRVQPALEIAQALREMPALRDLNGTIDRSGESARNYRLLHAGLRNFSAESLALRQRTGLDALPAGAEVELRPSERARQLLAVLRTDPEQRGLAKVTRDIMAALYLPRPLSELDELALGGFSDIANRGSLDRLLPSELANDDLTLATRIALNEALYIRREPPTNHPRAQLALLLDIGVRQWGLPRVFATAVALAFIAKKEQCTKAAAWRASRTGIVRSDLLSRSGLINHLSALDTYSHPGAALKPFFAQFAQEPEMEAVLVTHADSVADPEFQRCLAQIKWKTFYIAMVDRDGSFEMFAHPHRRKLLCQAKIELDALFSEKAPGTIAKRSPSLRDRKESSGLPLILSVRPFPFLLPILGKVDRTLRLPKGGGLALLKDRRLMRWDGPGKGAYTLVESVPAGKTLWLGTTDSGKKVHVLKLLGRAGVASLTSWDSITLETTSTDLTFWKETPQHVYERNGILFVISKAEVSAWQIDGARPLGKLEIPAGSRLSHERYLAHPNEKWSFLTYDGIGLRLEPVALPRELRQLWCQPVGRKVVALFDPAGFENLPWALTACGEVFSGDGKRVINLGLWPSHFHISHDGRRLLLYPAGKPDCHLVDLPEGTSVPLRASHGRESLTPPVGCPTRSLRVKLDAICYRPSGDLLLRSAAGVWYRIALTEKAICLVRGPTSAEVASPVTFEPIQLPPEFNFQLKLARWPDGSRAWLDSRGLLHLKHGNPLMPEISLVLADGPIAAWTSDGRTCGPDFFMADPANTDPAILMRRIELSCPSL